MIAYQTSSVSSTREQGLYIAAVSYTDDFKVGDRILAVGGLEVATCDQLRESISTYQPGDVASVLVLRDDELVEIEMTLTQADIPNSAAKPAA